MIRLRWLRWTVRTSLAAFAALVLVVLLVASLDPYGRVVVRILLQPLTANMHPPAIFADEMAGSQPPDWAETGRRLTARLHQKFPLGTTEDTLQKALLAEGFKPLPPPPSDCVPPVQKGQLLHVAHPRTICLPQDQSKSLRYVWGGGCDRTITVRWSTDDRSTVTLLDGYYDTACL